jgi:hypothetical protein
MRCTWIDHLPSGCLAALRQDSAAVVLQRRSGFVEGVPPRACLAVDMAWPPFATLVYLGHWHAAPAACS